MEKITENAVRAVIFFLLNTTLDHLHSLFHLMVLPINYYIYLYIYIYFVSATSERETYGL